MDMDEKLRQLLIAVKRPYKAELWEWVLLTLSVKTRLTFKSLQFEITYGLQTTPNEDKKWRRYKR